MNTTRSVIVLCYDLSEYRRTAEVIENLFSLFFPTWRTVLKNVCEIIPNWESEGLEESLLEAVYEQEKEETETKSVPGHLKNS